MGDVVFSLASIITLLVAFVARPTYVQCSPGWYVTAVAASGEFSCARTAPRSICDDRGGCSLAEQWSDPQLRSRLYCTGSSVPIVAFDGHSVGCQAVH